MKIDSQSQTQLVESNATLGSGLYINPNQLPLLTEILTRRIYKIPIRVICREILSNAKDAHRAAGCPERPIEVTLPHWEKPLFIIEDFGTGISPEMMETLYQEVLGSTKRNDESQIGGWGIGRLSIFSYTPEFTVVSTYEGVERTYLVTSETGAVLLSEVHVERGNGFKVIVEVKKRTSDLTNFRDYVAETCYHWKVRPTIVDVSGFWEDVVTQYGGTDWQLINIEPLKRLVGRNDTVCGPRVVALVGEIPYAVDINQLNLGYSLSNWCERVHQLVLHFDISDLPVDVSREQLNYLDTTKQVLKQRIEASYAELLNQVRAEIDRQDTLLKATRVLDDVWSLKPLLRDGELEWQGYAIRDTYSLPGTEIVMLNASIGVRELTNCIAKDADPERLFINDTKLVTVSDRWQRELAKRYPGERLLVINLRGEPYETAAKRLPYIDALQPIRFSVLQETWFPTTQRQRTTDNLTVQAYQLDPRFSQDASNRELKRCLAGCRVTRQQSPWFLIFDKAVNDYALDTGEVYALGKLLKDQLYILPEKSVKTVPQWRSINYHARECLEQLFEQYVLTLTLDSLSPKLQSVDELITNYQMARVLSQGLETLNLDFLLERHSSSNHLVPYVRARALIQQVREQLPGLLVLTRALCKHDTQAVETAQEMLFKRYPLLIMLKLQTCEYVERRLSEAGINFRAWLEHNIQDCDRQTTLPWSL